jgi:hypothetical protein
MSSRGIEGSFEGVDGNGKPVKINLKGVSLIKGAIMMGLRGAVRERQPATA